MNEPKHDYEQSVTYHLSKLLDLPENARLKSKIMSDPRMTEAMLIVLKRDNPESAQKVYELIDKWNKPK
jgi:hypothetical protein